MCAVTTTPKPCDRLEKLWLYTPATELLALLLGSKTQIACYLHSSLNIVMSVITDRLITDERKQTQTFSLQIISSVAGGRDAGVIDIASQTNECTPRVHSVWPRNRQKSKCCLPGSATSFAIWGSGEPAVIKANRGNPYFQMKNQVWWYMRVLLKLNEACKWCCIGRVASICISLLGGCSVTMGDWRQHWRNVDMVS